MVEQQAGVALTVSDQNVVAVVERIVLLPGRREVGSKVADEHVDRVRRERDVRIGVRELRGSFPEFTHAGMTVSKTAAAVELASFVDVDVRDVGVTSYGDVEAAAAGRDAEPIREGSDLHLAPEQTLHDDDFEHDIVGVRETEAGVGVDHRASVERHRLTVGFVWIGVALAFRSVRVAVEVVREAKRSDSRRDGDAVDLLERVAVAVPGRAARYHPLTDALVEDRVDHEVEVVRLDVPRIVLEGEVRAGDVQVFGEASGVHVGADLDGDREAHQTGR